MCRSISSGSSTGSSARVCGVSPAPTAELTAVAGGTAASELAIMSASAMSWVGISSPASSGAVEL
eukprot:scaffold2926_cov399-Prasinococcus_capsulatus_cf.AAC.7